MSDGDNDVESEDIVNWLKNSLTPHLRKRKTVKRKILRGTSYDCSTSSDVGGVSAQPFKYQSQCRNLGARYKKQRRISLGRIEQAQVNHKLLSEHCLSSTSPLIKLIDVIASNGDYMTLSPSKRKQFMLDACKGRSVGNCQFVLTIDTVKFNVCNRCFAAFHGLSRRSLQRVIASVNQGVVRLPVIQPDRRTGSTTLLKMEAAAWISQTYLHFGDYMPDESTICLPVYTKTELFDWYSSPDRNLVVYSKSAFFTLLRIEYPFICFRRFKKFMQCGFCHDIDWLVSVEKVYILLLFQISLLPVLFILALTSVQ
jgi:hypothetical protein